MVAMMGRVSLEFGLCIDGAVQVRWSYLVAEESSLCLCKVYIVAQGNGRNGA